MLENVIRSGPVQADGAVGRAEVECEECGALWEDVRVLVDIAEAKEKNGRGTKR